jgi:enediyne biosynthesis protein E4
VRVTAGGRTQLRFVDGGNGFAGQSSMRLHFGLGAATAIDKVEVRWPSGVKQTLTGVPVDMLTKIIEGSSQ